MNDLIKLDNISKRNGHIRAYPISHNMKRLNIGEISRVGGDGD